MANRRMFSKTIIGSARFLRMPISAQALYFHLGINADDEGVVEAFSVMRMVGAAEDDLRVLSAKGFIYILNEDLVSFIIDWKENNNIQKDRFKPSIYHELLVRIQPVSKVDTTCIQSVSKVDTTCIQSVSNMETQVKLGKDSLSKDSIREREKTERPKYGKYANVYLSDSELESIRKKYPNNWSEKIEYFSHYLKISGKRYQDHYATIMRWAKEDAKKEAKKSAPALNYQQHAYTEADFCDDFYYDPERDFLKGG